MPYPTTSLIHKKGSTSDISNFHPMALTLCIYKLLMAILARRITQWAIARNILSDEQKSIHPTEGCYKHGFLLQFLIGDTCHLKKNVFLAWLDMGNAFSSVPHAAIFTTLHHLGLPGPLIDSSVTHTLMLPPQSIPPLA